MERLERSVGEIVPFHKLIKADTPIKKVQATADRFKKKKKKKRFDCVCVSVCVSTCVSVDLRPYTCWSVPATPGCLSLASITLPYSHDISGSLLKPQI